MKKNSFKSRILRNIILSLFMLLFIPMTAQIREDVSISGTIKGSVAFRNIAI